MDLKGSLVDTNIKIFPSEDMIKFLKSVSDNNIPNNILKVAKIENFKLKDNNVKTVVDVINLSNEDIINLKKIKETYSNVTNSNDDAIIEKPELVKNKPECKEKQDTEENENEIEDSNENKKNNAFHLTTSDIDWLYAYIQKRKNNGDKNIPFLHTLLEGASIELPENQMIKRNPILEARCVKLRAQQEAREYKKMTRSVDNVRMRFPDDSIAYQLKQVNRQLIAVGQFIISIFAGFLFGFKGVEWTIGGLDFGFRLLLGVMCALVIALAEIYFLAKKLNEELTVPETTQLGGPPKFANAPNYPNNSTTKIVNKEHQD